MEAGLHRCDAQQRLQRRRSDTTVLYWSNSRQHAVFAPWRSVRPVCGPGIRCGLCGGHELPSGQHRDGSRALWRRISALLHRGLPCRLLCQRTIKHLFGSTPRRYLNGHMMLHVVAGQVPGPTRCFTLGANSQRRLQSTCRHKIPYECWLKPALRPSLRSKNVSNHQRAQDFARLCSSFALYHSIVDFRPSASVTLGSQPS